MCFFNPEDANSRWARHAAASTGVTVSERAQAPAASRERQNAEWRSAWQRARELGDEAPARHMCTYMYRHIYIYVRLCIYACIQLGNSLVAALALALALLGCARVDHLVGQLARDAQLQHRAAHRPREEGQWLALRCAPGRLRVLGGWAPGSPLQVLHLVDPLREQQHGLGFRALHLLVAPAIVVVRRGNGDPRCLVQQPLRASLLVARSLAHGLGHVPRPRARSLVEQRLADGLQEVFNGNSYTTLKKQSRFLAERRGIGCHGHVRGGVQIAYPLPPPPPTQNLA